MRILTTPEVRKILQSTNVASLAEELGLAREQVLYVKSCYSKWKNTKSAGNADLEAAFVTIKTEDLKRTYTPEEIFTAWNIVKDSSHENKKIAYDVAAKTLNRTPIALQALISKFTLYLKTGKPDTDVFKKTAEQLGLTVHNAELADPLLEIDIAIREFRDKIREIFTISMRNATKEQIKQQFEKVISSL